MPDFCIHGFRVAECASCRNCIHGLAASRCPRCLTAASLRSRGARPAPTASHPSEEHAGFEIFYVPAVSGWQFRQADSAPSALSYRSAFLARKAVDDQVAEAARRSSKDAQ